MPRKAPPPVVKQSAVYEFAGGTNLKSATGVGLRAKGFVPHTTHPSKQANK